jgi:N,N'-diacetyllegionaminate synthase
MARLVSVSGRVIGPGYPCFIIAEAGVNHNGDVDMAHKLIDAAVDAKVDAIKFQTFDPEKLAAVDAPKAEYQVENTGEAGSQLEMLRKLVLPKSAYPRLMSHAADQNLIFLSTPFDEESADFLEKIGIPAFKISSGDLTNHPFLAHVAKKNRTMLLSTGMSSLQEVEAAENVIEANGMHSLVLFHCVTNYPTDPADCNLRAMETLRSRFNVPTGWSDHTTGPEISLAAVAIGADTLEKHFTLDRSLPGPDHVASLEPSELTEMIRSIRRVESAMGDGRKQPKECELATAPVARKSLHWKNNLREGAIITATDIIALRPGTGISPAKLSLYVGRKTAKAVQLGRMMVEQDFTGKT